ncbi:MAG: hypothetical protein IKF99_15850 [Oscillospiraceae bacterium]|nr:hypothetical protein [Oscillospiraceae bacterium]MBR3239896.1 hypothetical protein [Oscillospiraceae bacterium]
MIVQEHFDVEGRDFIRTYSDANRYVVRDGESYAEACDPAEFGRMYTEGDPLPLEEIAAQAGEVLNILMGVSE